MKKAFSLIETILVISIIVFIGGFIIQKIHTSNLDDAVKRISLYLKQTRYQALIDNKQKDDEELWHKKRWTLKFLRCNKNIGGLYYNIYSDENETGQASLSESLIDPLTNKRVYSTNKCEYKDNTSKYVLLTKEFGIVDVQISCNNTSSLGQISFGNDGKVYSKLSSSANEYYEYEINSICTIKFIDNESQTKTLKIMPKTGYIY